MDIEEIQGCSHAACAADGITVHYIDPEGYVVTDDFKQRCLTWLRNQGGPIIYIGDGLSDLDAAIAADYVFATDHLHTLLEEASVPHYSYSCFTEITRCVSRFTCLPSRPGWHRAGLETARSSDPEQAKKGGGS